MGYVIRSMSLVTLAYMMVAGCIGLPQQSRFEGRETAGLLQMQAYKVFVPSTLLTFTQEDDGSVTVHTHAGSRLSPAVQPFSNETLTHVHQSLLPFLVPACEMP